MTTHERVECGTCKAVIRQCRCIGPHATTYETCAKCATAKPIECKPRVIGILQYTDGRLGAFDNPKAPRHVETRSDGFGPLRRHLFLSDGTQQHRTGTLTWLFREVTEAEFDADTERLRQEAVIP